ncbi:hypothetical protein BDP81DRAFT_165261 [Colletotrichum phormii]|uniref:Uncharacterized protein n=1 Tax=Colletotrichum phormii TaxID=359342 RepID=A0AAI9ZYI5_9PEZI|nr:uncharacterized protein BDP81DRAFT_165261 [Colletotrichum phormii]KAK1640561.1 hypothetical protein BDP81DRAFT_165261 [Colletotrichum phormii]
MKGNSAICSAAAARGAPPPSAVQAQPGSRHSRPCQPRLRARASPSPCGCECRWYSGPAAQSIFSSGGASLRSSCASQLVREVVVARGPSREFHCLPDVAETNNERLEILDRDTSRCGYKVEINTPAQTSSSSSVPFFFLLFFFFFLFRSPPLSGTDALYTVVTVKTLR